MPTAASLINAGPSNAGPSKVAAAPSRKAEPVEGDAGRSTIRDPRSGLAASIAAAVASVPSGSSGTAERVAAALRPFLGRTDLLLPAERVPAEGCYARNLVHADPEGRFSVWAMVWRPGQESSVHDHCCWCVMGVQEGVLVEEAFRNRNAGDEAPRVAGRRDCGVGAVRALEPGADDIHRIGNRGGATAISIHVYGFDPAQIASSVGRVYGC
ncbi:MAG: cysteine dioxygenase [Alphaproteobacteria bacterium]